MVTMDMTEPVISEGSASGTITFHTIFQARYPWPVRPR